MQVIAHLTDLMKYDLKPQKPLSTTTTIRPTPSHKPGLYAPQYPLGPNTYFNNKNLLDTNENRDYFNRYNLMGEDGSHVNYREIEKNVNIQDIHDLDLFGNDYKSFIKFINKIDETNEKPLDDDVVVRGLLNNLDDSKFGLELLRQKRVPPTRAYVTLLSLYDQLNKESKKLSLNKYGVCISKFFMNLIKLIKTFRDTVITC